jgi:hypothetical protein
LQRLYHQRYLQTICYLVVKMYRSPRQPCFLVYTTEKGRDYPQMEYYHLYRLVDLLIQYLLYHQMFLMCFQ